MFTAIGRSAWHTLTQNRRLLRAQQRRLLARDTPPIRVLEVGSEQRRGSSDFQSAVEFGRPETQFRMTDLDPALGHRVLDMTDPGTELGTLDLMLCCNVLEHVADLHAAFDGLASVCAEDGEIFASTPYVYPYHDEPHGYWLPTVHGLNYFLARRFDRVVVSSTGLRRFPFQIFVNASSPKS